MLKIKLCFPFNNFLYRGAISNQTYGKFFRAIQISKSGKFET
jgi:hypothetical protein